MCDFGRSRRRGWTRAGRETLSALPKALEVDRDPFFRGGPEISSKVQKSKKHKTNRRQQFPALQTAPSPAVPTRASEMGPEWPY